MGIFGSDKVFRGTCKDKVSAAVSCLRTEVYNPVCSTYYIEIVLHYNNRMTF